MNVAVRIRNVSNPNMPELMQIAGRPGGIDRFGIAFEEHHRARRRSDRLE
jgi:hypothetical protein